MHSQCHPTTSTSKVKHELSRKQLMMPIKLCLSPDSYQLPNRPLPQCWCLGWPPPFRLPLLCWDKALILCSFMFANSESRVWGFCFGTVLTCGCGCGCFTVKLPFVAFLWTGGTPTLHTESSTTNEGHKHNLNNETTSRGMSTTPSSQEQTMNSCYYHLDM